MAKYRQQLPQLSGDLFLISGGLETSIIYEKKVDLPCFASFEVLKDESGREWMKNHLIKFVQIAQKYSCGIILVSPTWRASQDWLTKLGYQDEDLININRKSIQLLEDIRDKYETDKCLIVINGSIGPRGDGYNPTTLMTPEQAQEYHSKQISVFSETNTDMITGYTLNYPDEAIGMVRAANQVKIPIAISFTVETDGKLPTGQTLKEAIQLVDEATANSPVYYMINCAHPTAFKDIFIQGQSWCDRIHGIQGNASKKSHAQLDESKELDSGNPIEFGEDNEALLYKLNNLNILGGCCGTNNIHLEQICKASIETFKQTNRMKKD